MGFWIRDVRVGARALVKRPGFAALVVATLALGLGANAAIFSVVDAVLLRPLPYPEPDRLVRLFSAYPADGEDRGATSPIDLDDWRRTSNSFSEIAAYPRVRMGGFVLTSDDAPSEIETLFVTEGFFATFGVPAALGRTLDAADHVEGENQVVVLSRGAWERRFGGEPDVVGQSITMNGREFTIVGVMPERFDFPSSDTEMWAPLSLIPDSGVPRRRDVRFLSVVARLERGVTLEQARAEMRTIAGQLATEYPDSNDELTAVTVRPLASQLVAGIRPALLTVFGAVGLVLLIVCVNVSSLILARSEGRSKEIAVRTALGAGRWPLVRQLLIESLLLSLLGAVAGVLLAEVGVRALIATAPAAIPRLQNAGVDGVVLGFTAALAVLAAVLTGLFPALRVTVSSLGASLKEGGRSQVSGRSARRFRGALVVSEVALVVMLATVALLLVRSYSRLVSVDPGVRSENLLSMSVRAQSYKYPSRVDYVEFFERVLERVESVPGVGSAGWVRPFPLRGDRFEGESFSFTVDGEPAPSEGREPTAAMRFVSPGYFRTMGIPLLSGRDFDERERGGSLAIVLNRTASERYWPGGDAVGRTISVGRAAGVEVIGVVGDVRQLALGDEPKPAVYVTLRQVARVGMTLVVRTRAEPESMVHAVQDAIWEIDRDQPIEQIATMEAVIDESVAEPRFSMALLGMFAALSVLLAAVGIYGAMAMSVQQDTHDIGVRLALGATRGTVLTSIVGRGLGLAAAGVGIGLTGALGVSRLTSSLLFGVSTTDPMSFVSAAGLLLVVAVAASVGPARRAARLDPVAALRDE